MVTVNQTGGAYDIPTDFLRHVGRGIARPHVPLSGSIPSLTYSPLLEITTLTTDCTVAQITLVGFSAHSCSR